MLDDNLELRKELFEKEIDKLIDDFSKKKKHYYKNYMKLCWFNVVVNAGISFSVGVSFIESVELQFKVVALVLSSVLLIINGAMNFLNYKNLYEQRTRTLVNLLSLKREYKLMVRYNETESDFNDLCNKLQTIMQDDLGLWLENIPKENSKGVN